MIDIDTDKGYKPKDLINKSGKFNITLNYIKKEFNKKYTVEDPYGVKRSYWNNLNKYRKFEIAGELFNKNIIDSNFENITDKRIFNNVLSQIYWYNQ